MLLGTAQGAQPPSGRTSVRHRAAQWPEAAPFAFAMNEERGTWLVTLLRGEEGDFPWRDSEALRSSDMNGAGLCPLHGARLGLLSSGSAFFRPSVQLSLCSHSTYSPKYIPASSKPQPLSGKIK